MESFETGSARQYLAKYFLKLPLESLETTGQYLYEVALRLPDAVHALSLQPYDKRTGIGVMGGKETDLRSLLYDHYCSNHLSRSLIVTMQQAHEAGLNMYAPIFPINGQDSAGLCRIDTYNEWDFAFLNPFSPVVMNRPQLGEGMRWERQEGVELFPIAYPFNDLAMTR
ncbi:MAG: hypothetical protein QY318_04775 [Candidatus Dojkabacteria bacterium]|nr:MAG: hypothetical protein QY318_04775 [Candidatus Dojkabacteria bacterium]